MIGTGRRDAFVLLQQAVSSVDTTGAPTTEWVDLCHAWVHRSDVGGRERLTADQISASGDTVWELLYLASMDPDLVDLPALRRVVYRGWIYDVVHAVLLDRIDGRAIQLRTLGRKAEAA